MDEPIGVTYSEQMQSAINKLRRLIGDDEGETSADNNFSDEFLYNYIADAADELELGLYKTGVVVRDNDFYNKSGEVVNLSGAEQNIYCRMAQIIIKAGVRDKADRENFLIRKGKLTIDLSRQSSSHGETLKDLEKKLMSAISLLKMSSIKGVRVE